MTVEPVFVTAEPPRMAKPDAVPRDVWANAGEALQRSTANPTVARRDQEFFILNRPFARDPDGAPAEERLVPVE
jgi:hypothetical protein